MFLLHGCMFYLWHCHWQPKVVPGLCLSRINDFFLKKGRSFDFAPLRKQCEWMSRCSHNQPIHYLNKLGFPLTVSVRTLDSPYLPAGVSVGEHCATGPPFTQGGWWISSESASGSCTFAAKSTSPCRKWSMMLLKVSQHSTHSRLFRCSVSEEY